MRQPDDKAFHHQADDCPMNDRTLSVLAIALSVVAIIASVSAIVISQDAGDDMEDSWKYTTYFGLEDISPDRADEIEKEIEDLVTQTYGLGFTNFRALLFAGSLKNLFFRHRLKTAAHAVHFPRLRLK